jgi:hypothetical protein
MTISWVKRRTEMESLLREAGGKTTEELKQSGFFLFPDFHKTDPEVNKIISGSTTLDPYKNTLS